jgi:FMN reductase
MGTRRRPARSRRPCVLAPLNMTGSHSRALQAKPVGIVAMGGSAHHSLAVDTQLRQVLGWFGALVAPTSIYLTGADFRDGQLAAEAARTDLVALVDTLLLLLRRLEPASLGPTPLAGKFT